MTINAIAKRGQVLGDLQTVLEFTEFHWRKKLKDKPTAGGSYEWNWATRSFNL